MKKITILIIVIAMMLSIIGCGNKISKSQLIGSWENRNGNESITLNIQRDNSASITERSRFGENTQSFRWELSDNHLLLTGGDYPINLSIIDISSERLVAEPFRKVTLERLNRDKTSNNRSIVGRWKYQNNEFGENMIIHFRANHSGVIEITCDECCYDTWEEDNFRWNISNNVLTFTESYMSDMPLRIIEISKDRLIYAQFHSEERLIFNRLDDGTRRSGPPRRR